MRHPLRGLGALALSVLPVFALACGDSDSNAAAPAASTDTPDGGDVDDGSASPDAPAEPITVKVRLTALKVPSAYVVFYPKASPENPVVEQVSDGQSVSKLMPDGADIVIVVAVKGNTLVLQIDEVASGETIDFDASRGATEEAALDVRRLIPTFDGRKDLNYSFQGCHLVPDDATAGDEPTMGQYDPLCVEPGNKVRFLATAMPSGNAVPLGIAGSVVDLATAGTPPLAAVGSWSTPKATTWSFSGSAPGASEYTATVFATNSTTFGGFRLYGGLDISAQGSGTYTFLRPPAGFNDGELHWASAAFPTATNDGSEMSAAILVDRTSPSAALSTDFNSLGPHFTVAPQVTTNQGAADFAFQASAAFPAGTTFVMSALHIVSETEGVSWMTITTRGEQNKIAGRRLPDVVRQVTGDVDWSQSNIIQARAITGFDARVLRATPFGTVGQFSGTTGGDYGLPPGNFQAKVASFNRRTN